MPEGAKAEAAPAQAAAVVVVPEAAAVVALEAEVAEVAAEAAKPKQDAHRGARSRVAARLPQRPGSS